MDVQFRPVLKHALDLLQPARLGPVKIVPLWHPFGLKILPLWFKRLG